MPMPLPEVTSMARALASSVLLFSLVALSGCEDSSKGADSGASDDTGGSMLADGAGGDDGGDAGAVDCTGKSVIVFYGEGGDGEDNPAVLAAQALGAEVQFTKEEDQLTQWLEAGDAAAVVIDSPARRPDDEQMPLFQGLIDSGVPLIIGIYDLHREDEWMAMLEVEAVDQWDSRELYPAAGASADLFSLHQELPAGLKGQYSTWAIDGHALTPTNGGEVLAVFDSADGSEGAVVTTHGGTVMVNGLFGDVFVRMDNDEDGIPDIQELFENELVHMGTCG
jgi:hypothetical protein